MTGISFSFKRNCFATDFTVEFVFTVCQIRVSVNLLKAINGSALMAVGNTLQLQSGCCSICDPPVSPPENTSLRRGCRLYFRPSEDTSLKKLSARLEIPRRFHSLFYKIKRCSPMLSVRTRCPQLISVIAEVQSPPQKLALFYLGKPCEVVCGGLTLSAASLKVNPHASAGMNGEQWADK